MRVVEFLTQNEAQTFQAIVDAGLGYPQTAETCPAVPVGDGRHVTHNVCCAVTYAAPLQDSGTGGTGLWYYPIDDSTASYASANGHTVNENFTLAPQPPPF